jgi:hypothetical protein
MAMVRAAVVGAEGADADPAEVVPPACLRQILELERRRCHGLAGLQQRSLAMIFGNDGPARGGIFISMVARDAIQARS